MDKNIIKVKTYNNLADKCYRKLVTGNEIYIVGILETSGEIELQEIYVFK